MSTPYPSPPPSSSSSTPDCSNIGFTQDLSNQMYDRYRSMSAVLYKSSLNECNTSDSSSSCISSSRPTYCQYVDLAMKDPMINAVISDMKQNPSLSSPPTQKNYTDFYQGICEYSQLISGQLSKPPQCQNYSQVSALASIDVMGCEDKNTDKCANAYACHYYSDNPSSDTNVIDQVCGSNIKTDPIQKYNRVNNFINYTRACFTGAQGAQGTQGTQGVHQPSNK